MSRFNKWLCSTFSLNCPSYDPAKDPSVHKVESVAKNIDRVLKKVAGNELADTLLGLPVPFFDPGYDKPEEWKR